MSPKRQLKHDAVADFCPPPGAGPGSSNQAAKIVMNAIRLQFTLDGRQWVTAAFYNLNQELEALEHLARLKILYPYAQWRCEMPAYV